jgi:Icc-related predicted phosphoesterase
VKILALSDEVVEFIYSPQVKERFGEVDFVVGCGDLPFYYLEFIVTLLDKPVYYIHGNHDKPSQFLSDGRIIDRAEGCQEVEDQCMRVQVPGRDVLLAGLGGSMRYNDGPHQYTQGEMASRVLKLTPALLVNRARHGRFVDIVIAHSPPRGIHDADDQAHIGFDAFRQVMDRFRPRFLLHGHSHIYRNDTVTATRYGETQVVNVYPYRLIEYDRDYV